MGCRNCRNCRNIKSQIMPGGFGGFCSFCSHLRAPRREVRARACTCQLECGSCGGPNVTRQRLPNRREHELPNVEHAGIRYTAGVGGFADGGVGEIFLNTAKRGTAHVNARAAAVAASPLVQHRCPVDTLRQAVTANSDGSDSGPLACALDLLVE